MIEVSAVELGRLARQRLDLDTHLHAFAGDFQWLVVRLDTSHHPDVQKLDRGSRSQQRGCTSPPACSRLSHGGKKESGTENRARLGREHGGLGRKWGRGEKLAKIHTVCQGIRTTWRGGEGREKVWYLFAGDAHRGPLPDHTGFDDHAHHDGVAGVEYVLRHDAQLAREHCRVPELLLLLALVLL